jgi:hypothetical protein
MLANASIQATTYQALGEALLRSDAGRAGADALPRRRSARLPHARFRLGQQLPPLHPPLLDVLAGSAPQEMLAAREGRRVIALHDLFQRSNAEGRAVAG